jgi:hypothetical protein
VVAEILGLRRASRRAAPPRVKAGVSPLAL